MALVRLVAAEERDDEVVVLPGGWPTVVHAADDGERIVDERLIVRQLRERPGASGAVPEATDRGDVPSEGLGWYTWLLEDQRFVQGRRDVLSWETDTLTEDVVLAGEVTAKLFASTTGGDADWIVKLIDVYPEKYDANPKLGGYELMVSNDVFRGRFHKSFEKPVPLVPNAVTPFTVDLHTQSYRFQKGHRIMVQCAEHLVPDHRPESADVGAEHLPGDREGLQGADAPSLQNAHPGITSRDPDGRALTSFRRAKRVEESLASVESPLP